LQSCFYLFEFVLDLSLDAINIQAFGIGMTGYTGANNWRKGMIGIRACAAQVASHAGIFHGGIVGGGFAFNSTSATDAKDQRSFWTMVATPVSAGDVDFAICCGGESGTLLMAVGTHIAHATIISGIKRNEFDRGNGFESPVISGISGVYVMASAAIDAACIRFGGLLSVSVIDSGCDCGIEATA
jgi:hypothetical protein